MSLLPPGRALGLLILLILIAAQSLLEFACSTPDVHVQLTSPSTATIGLPFTITVTVMANGRQAGNSTVICIFPAPDPAAVLPPVYSFTGVNQGSHTFVNGVILMTPGNQTIKATDIIAFSINGTTLRDVKS
jgi:hypothetical protein